MNNTTTDIKSDFSDSLDREMQHITTLIDQKIENLRSLLNQRIDFFEESSKKDIEALGYRVTETFQEVRGYKEILTQQMTLVDASSKTAHSRIDKILIQEAVFTEKLEKISSDLSETVEKFNKLLESTLVDCKKELTTLKETEIKELKEDIEGIKQQHHDEQLILTTRKTDPIRSFMRENSKELLVILGTFLLLFVIKNWSAFIEFIQTNG